MIKRLLSRAVPEHEWPIWIVPSFILGGFLLSTLLFYLFYFGPGIRDIQGITYAPTDNQERIKFEIGGTLFSVPAHYTRDGQTRRGGALPYANLHALLPNIQPWRTELADDFLDTSTNSPLLSVTIRSVQRDMAEARLFSALYQPYIDGAGQVTDSGLQAFSFRSNSPYGRKQIFKGLPKGSSADRATAPLFICDTETHNNPVCESRFDLGNTAQVSYTFKRVHLAEWETIDGDLKELIRNFRAAARRQN